MIVCVRCGIEPVTEEITEYGITHPINVCPKCNIIAFTSPEYYEIAVEMYTSRSQYYWKYSDETRNPDDIGLDIQRCVGIVEDVMEAHNRISQNKNVQIMKALQREE